MKNYDIVLIGGGFVGGATAWPLKQRPPDASILLLEKEKELAGHQTGRYSGVIYAGFWKILARNLRSGLEEVRDAFHRPGYLARVRRYCLSLTLGDLKPYPTGIRAQAVTRRGQLVHDFLFAESERSLHVCNAPSAAATSAIPIGEYLCEKATAKFGLQD